MDDPRHTDVLHRDGNPPGSDAASARPANAPVTRRDVLRASAAVSLAGFLGACANTRRVAGRMPDPIWPTPAPVQRDPIVRAPDPIRPSAPGSSFDVLPRSLWTRSGIARPAEAYPMAGIGKITIHHDAEDSSDVRSQADAAARIEHHRRFHVENRGWADIGYHYLVDPQGRVWEGRPLAWQGAHVKDHNEHNIGVVVMGNFEHQTPTLAALRTVDRFVPYLMTRYNVRVGDVFTHQEFAPTLCPGRNLQRYMTQARASNGSIRQATA